MTDFLSAVRDRYGTPGKPDQCVDTAADQTRDFPRLCQMCGTLKRVQFIYTQFGSGLHVRSYHALEDSPGKAQEQTMNNHPSHKKKSSDP